MLDNGGWSSSVSEDSRVLLTKAYDRALDTPEGVVLADAVAGGGAVGWAELLAESLASASR